MVNPPPPPRCGDLGPPGAGGVLGVRGVPGGVLPATAGEEGFERLARTAPCMAETGSPGLIPKTFKILKYFKNFTEKTIFILRLSVTF